MAALQKYRMSNINDIQVFEPLSYSTCSFSVSSVMSFRIVASSDQIRVLVQFGFAFFKQNLIRNFSTSGCSSILNRCLHVLDFSLSGFLNLELMLARSRCLYQLPNTEKGFLGMLNYTLQSLGVALLGSQWPTRPPFSRSASPFRQLLLHSRSCSRSCSCVLNPEA